MSAEFTGHTYGNSDKKEVNKTLCFNKKFGNSKFDFGRKNFFLDAPETNICRQKILKH